jgi:light-regulated signal transduction histidine kinase (bacteriophytochrome)
MKFLKYVTHVLGEKIFEAKAVVKVHPLPVITGNKSLLNQLFMNLVGNALKYRGDKKPEIEIGSTEEQDKWMFYVKDNGIGIDPRHYEKIFIIFQRIHARSEYSGTGIGLAICKKIVEKHNGNIWVESEPGKGSTFFFTIPKKTT